MPIGLIGRKCGMTRVFTEEDVSIPVTVIEVEPNSVTQVKNEKIDGYCAVQVTTGSRKVNRITKPETGHFAKAGVEAGRGLWEFCLTSEECKDVFVGKQITLNILQPKQKVDVTGMSIGKGYAGVVKRHNFRTQDATHGNSLSHRAPGSIGQNQTPGRVFKGKRMAGHMGNVRRTIQNLEVVRVDEVGRFILIKGAVPGPKGGNVILNVSCKVGRKRSD
uniref:Large ribosomal subunit protein uL3 n=1 Tax=Candidatus Kentrum sp. TUN TaxID=2126343 RepID=A0A450ZUW5_9GAMM|nr:MAG: large subunit ribosomal protein L3 [Candidatus Kentron sp. TUN]